MKEELRYNKTFFKPGDTHVLYDTIEDEEECNLYLVSTPGQLLSAIEAQNYFKTKNNVLVILFFVVGDGKNINHMFELSKYFPYDRLITYQNANTKNYKAFTKYLNILNKNIYNYIFVGYDSIAYRRMIVNVHYKELCFIDSGAHIMNVQKHYFSQNPQDIKYNIKSFKQLSLKGKYTQLQYGMRGYKRDGYTKPPRLFTVFDLLAYDSEDIIRHEYKHVKDLFKLDIELYKSKLLTIYNNSIAGHKEVLVQRRVRSLGVENKSLNSSSGVNLELYPNVVSTIPNYTTRLQSALIQQEKQMLTMKVKSDKDFLKLLQLSLVMKDATIFTHTLNSIMHSFLRRLHEIEEKRQVLSSFKRIVGIMSTLTESFKLLCNETKNFVPKIDEDLFYQLFNYFILFTNNKNNTVEKTLILTKKLSQTYGYFFGALHQSKSIEKAEQYFKRNSHIFKTQKIKTLILMLELQKSSTPNLYNIANKLAKELIKKKQYKHTRNSFYDTLSLLDILNRDIEQLIKYFIDKNFSILNTELHLNALKIMIKNASYRKIIRNRAFDIFNRGSFKRVDRISAGLIAAESYMYQGNQAQATKYFLRVWSKYACVNRAEALKYLDLMNVIGLLSIQRELYEKLYVQYIFGPFTNTYNSGIVLDGLKYNRLLHLKYKEDKQNFTSLVRQIQLKYDRTFFKPGDTHVLYDTIKDEEECNLYLVSTPGQLLSAIEAQNYFKTKNNVLVIFFFVVGDGKNINHIFELSKYFPYDRLITYQNKSAKFYLSFIPFLKYLRKYNYEHIFIGFNTILYRRICANLNYTKLFYLDDGVHTITTHDITYGGRKPSPEYKPFNWNLNLLKMVFIYGKHGLKVDHRLDNLNFFTVYNLKQYKDENIIKHNYSYVRSIFDITNIKNEDVYLLGQPLVNIGFKQDVYDSYLKHIFTTFKGYKIIYCPHRLEKVSQNIKLIIEQSENIELFDPGMPIELYFLNKGIYPFKVVSFITSALFNIRKIYPRTKTIAFKLDTTGIEQFQAEGISKIYNQYKNEDIDILPLPNYNKQNMSENQNIIQQDTHHEK